MIEREPEPVSFSPGLRLLAFRFIDENTLEYDFEGIGTADETFELSRSSGPIELHPVQTWTDDLWLAEWARLRSRVALARSSEVGGQLSRDVDVGSVHDPSDGCCAQSRSLV